MYRGDGIKRNLFGNKCNYYEVPDTEALNFCRYEKFWFTHMQDGDRTSVFVAPITTDALLQH